jgi:hypothetical protein
MTVVFVVVMRGKASSRRESGMVDGFEARKSAWVDLAGAWFEAYLGKKQIPHP